MDVLNLLNERVEYLVKRGKYVAADAIRQAIKHIHEVQKAEAENAKALAPQKDLIWDGDEGNSPD